MPFDEDGVVRDDKSFDWGTRFRPDPTLPPDAHLGKVQEPVENTPYDKSLVNPKRKGPDPDKLVVPPSNVPEPAKVEALVEKVLTAREQKALFTESELQLKNQL
jgi:hypothetical protein